MYLKCTYVGRLHIYQEKIFQVCKEHHKLDEYEVKYSIASKFLLILSMT